MMIGNNLADVQLQQIVDKTILWADSDGDEKLSFDEFCKVRITHINVRRSYRSFIEPVL